MYGPSQVVYDLDNNKPMLAYEYDCHNTHLVCANHRSEHVSGSVQTFRCETCEDVNHYRPTTEYIYVGKGKTNDERLKHAEEMIKAGRIKPAHDLAYYVARDAEWARERAEAKDKPSILGGDYERYKREEFRKVFLRFWQPQRHEVTDRIVEGRRGDWHVEDQFRTAHNFRVIEQARRDYMVAITKLQEELSATYNPQFIEESYDDPALDWPTRQAIIAEVWGQHRNLRKD